MKQDSTHKFSLKKHKKFLIFLFILVLILGWFVIPKPVKAIETQTIKRGNILETLAATGTINALTAVDLNFLSSGKLVYLGVKKGDSVQEGQVIANLDQRTVQKNLQDDLRDYSKQRNTFEQTKSDNQNRTPQQALNDTMRRVLENNQYDLEKAVISVELQDLARQQSLLISPISGIVTRADVVTSGVNVGVATTFTIADPNNLIFKMDIDEADIGKIHVGQTVKIVLDPYPEQTLELPISAIDFVTHTTATGGNAYTVEVPLPVNTNFKYRIGMNGDVEVILNQRKNVPKVSLASIEDEQYVYVKTAKGFEKRKVTLGIKDDTDAQVTSGLTLGEQVALDPAAAKSTTQKKRFLFF